MSEEFEQIVRRYTPNVRSYLNRILGPFLAEDAMQMVFAEAYVKRHVLPTAPRALEVWLIRTARFKARRILEQRERQRTPEATSLAAVDVLFGGTPARVDDSVAEREWAHCVLAQLDEKERQLWWLLSIEQAGVDAIARELKISYSNATTRIHRLRGRLTELMADAWSPEH